MTWLTALRRPFPAYAVASLAAVAVGALVCALSGVPAALWGRNLAGWLVGALAAAALGRWAGARAFGVVAVLAPLGVAASQLDPGQEGVRRWLDLGPLYVNAAMLLLPALAVALAVLAERSAWWWAPALLAQAVLVLQPDASQAAAVALALSVVALGPGAGRPPWRWALPLVALPLAAVAWTRPDPLQPVAEVEEVIQLAAGVSPLLAGLSVLALAAFAATPALTTRRHPEPAVRRAGLALAALLLAWCAAPALGPFPTPLVGIGLSPILGAWLGVGLLAASARSSRR
jgi:hypothetical protein